MNTDNRDHVAISTDSGVNWDFIISSEATTCAEQASEMTEHCTQLFDTFDDFLTPIELVYPIWVYSENYQLEDDDATEPVDTMERNLHNEAGLTAHDFVASTRIDHPGARRIPRIQFDHNRLRIRLDDGDRFVDQTDCVSYSKGEPVNWEPTWDPLDVTVFFNKNRRYDDIEPEYVFHISVSLRSGVWIERTESGDINRTYLSAFLERIADTLPVDRLERDIYRTSDLWTDLSLQDYTENFDPKDIY